MWFSQLHGLHREEFRTQFVFLSQRLTVCHCLHSVLKDAIQLAAAASAIHWSSFHLPKFVQLPLTLHFTFSFLR